MQLGPVIQVPVKCSDELTISLRHWLPYLTGVSPLVLTPPYILYLQRQVCDTNVTGPGGECQRSLRGGGVDRLLSVQ